MQKGKYGICLWFYAVLAFVLAFLGQTLLSGLLFGFVIVTEKNQWLSRQVLQAFFLCLLVSVMNRVLESLRFLESTPLIGGLFGMMLSVLTGLVSLLALFVALAAIVRVAKEREADLPILARLADRACGLLEEKVYPQTPPVPPAPPVYTPPVQPSQNPIDPQRPQ